MGDREELAELRRLAELEARASKVPDPGLGNVMLNAVPKGVANLLNTPVTLWNLAKQATGAMHPQIKDYMEPTPNYPMQAAESIGLVDPAKNPQTPVQRIADAAVQSGVGALAGPGGILKNAATGVVSGGVGQTTTEATGSPLAGMAAGMATPFALRAAFAGQRPLNEAQRATLNQGREAGYVMPPTEVNPSLANNILESAAGKAALKQQATLRNQNVSQALAARDMDLPASASLTPQAHQAYRQQQAQPYRETAAISPQAARSLENLRDARAEANAYWNHYNRSALPQSQRDARTYDALAAQYDDELANIANQAGQPGLPAALARSRTNIARSHDIENASSVTGEVSAPALGRTLDRHPLSGGTELIARYQQTFPKFMGEGAKTPTPGVSYTNAILSGGLGAGGAAAFGPYGALLAAAPFARGGLRQALLSGPYQRFSTSMPESVSDTATRAALIADILAARQQQGVK